MKKKDVVIGREQEIEILNRIFSSKTAEFIAMYGRRRVGKTYLIRAVFKKKSCYFFNSTGIYKGAMKTQLEEFTKQISRTFYQGAPIKDCTNWFDAFQFMTDTIEKQAKRKKVVLFFDEFPWMVTPRSKLMEALEYFWNQHWSQMEHIKLIVCGSSASWIIHKIIHAKGGLHNRLTRTLLLEPMSLNEVKKMLSFMGIRLKNSHITNIYMATGGIPYYLSQIPKGLSDTQIIEKLAFTKNGLFLDEFKKLYASLFEDAESYTDLVRIIASHRYGIAQSVLYEKIKKLKKGGTVSKRLQELEEAGFIISFKPFGHRRKGVFYKVIDEYTLFYFHWIEPIKNSLHKQGLRAGYWDKMRKTPAWSSWAGYAFEAICYKHLHQISEALNLSPTALPSAWQHHPKKQTAELGAQIDLLFDRDDDAITVCEIKYSSKPFVIDREYAKKLQAKLSVFQKQTKTQKQLFLSMICANGLKPSMYSEDLVDSSITLNDLFI